MKQFLLPLLLLTGCASTGDSYRNWGAVGDSVERVSLVALIARPELYEGKAVRVIGAFRLEFEGNAVCLHSEDIEKGISNNCLWISLDMAKVNANPEELKALNGGHALLEGTFTSRHRGHFGMYSGSIENIWRVARWPGY